MDFNDTPQEAEFRADAAHWLANNQLTDGDREGKTPLEIAKLWQQRKYDGGWACIGWDTEYGGRGASPIERVIWDQEESKYDVPSRFFVIGQGMIAPTLMVWAQPQHKENFLPKLASGEEIWCQLFSEPAGGSDLAALRTKAEKDGDEWVINGQKIWTSQAHYADYGIIVTRTDPTVAKHKGLTMFIVDMKAPGIDIKPIKQLTGESDFNEVYFTDVRIPDHYRLGDVGQGWTAALTTLMNERLAIGGGGPGADVKLALEIATLVEIDGKPAIEDSAVRAKIADFHVLEAGLEYNGYRAITALSRGELPGPENSIGKLVGAPKLQAVASFCMDLLEESGIVWSDGDLLTSLAQRSYMGAPGLRIAGGTDEIMTNIIAERVLGLPQDPRLDKGIPFNEVPTGN
ncbi:MAG: acyl-CoA dehydrogenase family protein [Halieaceae bacterium]|jgi:acyl-CoA dehydrogenase